VNARDRRAVVTGRVLSGLVVAFMLFSAGIKFTGAEAVRATMQQLGFPSGLTPGLGVLELACTLLYALPRTARVGAVVLTGYLGGACATHLRLLDPWLSHTLFPIWLGAFAWAGLLMRDPALRRLLAARSPQPASP